MYTWAAVGSVRKGARTHIRGALVFTPSAGQLLSRDQGRPAYRALPSAVCPLRSDAPAHPIVRPRQPKPTRRRSETSVSAAMPCAAAGCCTSASGPPASCAATAQCPLHALVPPSLACIHTWLAGSRAWSSAVCCGCCACCYLATCTKHIPKTSDSRLPSMQPTSPQLSTPPSFHSHSRLLLLFTHYPLPTTHCPLLHHHHQHPNLDLHHHSSLTILTTTTTTITLTYHHRAHYAHSPIPSAPHLIHPPPTCLPGWPHMLCRLLARRSSGDNAALEYVCTTICTTAPLHHRAEHVMYPSPLPPTRCHLCPCTHWPAPPTSSLTQRLLAACSITSTTGTRCLRLGAPSASQLHHLSSSRRCRGEAVVDFAHP